MTVGRTATIMLMVVALVAHAGAASAAEQPDCIDVTQGWEVKLAPHFGQRACIIGPFSVGADGVFIVTDPPAGPPPYGALISIDMPKVDAAKTVREPGTRVAVMGLLLGRSFCKANPSVTDCNEQTDATFFRYYLHQATFADGRSGKGASSSRALDHGALSPAIIEALEARIVMPTRHPLNSYVRYYKLAPLKEEGGAMYIFGEFERTLPGKG